MKLFGSNSNLEDTLTAVRNYQKFIYLFVFFLIGAQLYLMLVQPKLNDSKLKKQQLADYSVVLNSKKSKALDKAQIDQEVQKLTLNLAVMEQAIFSPAELNAFYITGLHVVATQTNVKLKSIQLAKGVSTVPGIEIVTLSLDLKGGFAEVISFLNILENYHKTVIIHDLSLSRASVKPIVLNGKIQLSLFMRPLINPVVGKGSQ